MKPLTFEPPDRRHAAGAGYACYPTAEHLVESFSGADLGLALARRSGIAAPLMQPLTLHVNFPLSAAESSACSCKQGANHNPGHAADYIRLLMRETELVTHCLGTGQAVRHLHLGGAASGFLSHGGLPTLLATLARSFKLLGGGERSIRVGIRELAPARLQALVDLGFNRLELEVHDLGFEPQQAVQCKPPVAKFAEWVVRARESGFHEVTIEVVRGLPRQTSDSFARTLENVATLRPDRINLHDCVQPPAHSMGPLRAPLAELPGAAVLAAVDSWASRSLLPAGYLHIGLNQFVLPDALLGRAWRQCRLYRDMQGYSAHPTGDQLGLGLSAMSGIGPCYSQNLGTLTHYCDSLAQGRLPVLRGLVLGRDDLVRRSVIMALLCRGQVVFEAIEQAWLIDFDCYFEAELERLRRLQAHGLVLLDGAGIQVTAGGRFRLGEIAALFNRPLPTAQAGPWLPAS